MMACNFIRQIHWPNLILQVLPYEDPLVFRKIFLLDFYSNWRVGVIIEVTPELTDHGYLFQVLFEFWSRFAKDSRVYGVGEGVPAVLTHDMSDVGFFRVRIGQQYNHILPISWGGKKLYDIVLEAPWQRRSCLWPEVQDEFPQTPKLHSVSYPW